MTSKRRYENAIRKLLEKGDSESEEILRFASDMRAEGISFSRVEKYIYHLNFFLRWLPGNRFSTKIEDIKDAMRQLEDSDYRPKTKAGFKQAVKKFYTWRGHEGLVDWIKTTVKKKDRRKFFQILTPEEKEKVRTVAVHPRDAAIIALCEELGLRPGELAALRLKDFEIDDNGIVIHVPQEGKTGARRIRMIEKVAILTKWLEAHPLKGNPEASAWPIMDWHSKKIMTGELTLKAISSRVFDLGKKAELKRPLSIYLYRHTAATEKAQWMTEAQMKVYFGWEADSTMPAIYIHLAGRDLDDPMLEHYGLKEPKKSDKPLRCERCNEINEPGTRYCFRCGYPLTADVKRKAKDREEKASKIIEVTYETRLQRLERMLEKFQSK